MSYVRAGHKGANTDAIWTSLRKSIEQSLRGETLQSHRDVLLQNNKKIIQYVQYNNVRKWQFQSVSLRMNTVSLTLIFQSTLTETNFCNVKKPRCGSGSERIRINLSDPNFSLCRKFSIRRLKKVIEIGAERLVFGFKFFKCSLKILHRYSLNFLTFMEVNFYLILY